MTYTLILLLILALVRNHRMLQYTLEDEDVLEPARKGWPSRVCSVDETILIRRMH